MQHNVGVQVQGIPPGSSITVFTASGLLPGGWTPTTVRPFASRPSWIRLNWGKSLRQGPHHSAQKSRMTTLPRSDSQVRGLLLSQVAPAGNSGAGLPMSASMAR